MPKPARTTVCLILGTRQAIPTRGAKALCQGKTSEAGKPRLRAGTRLGLAA